MKSNHILIVLAGLVVLGGLMLACLFSGVLLWSLGRGTAAAEGDQAGFFSSGSAGGGAMFIQPDKKIASASVVVDEQGGQHLASVDYIPYAEHPAALYHYCPPATDCTRPENWTTVRLGDNVNEVQLALTPAGQPRLLFQAGSTVYDLTDKDYYYAACDSNCTDPQNWASVYLLSSSGTAIFDVSDGISPQRYFSLDPQGRPRFVYLDRNYFYAEPDHTGVYYVFCDIDCTNAGNWSQTRISLAQDYDYEVAKYPALAFTSQGWPRVVADLSPLASSGEPAGIYYLACETGCENGENWGRVGLYNRGSGVTVSWDLELDRQDRPRLAYYQGEGDEKGDQLYYAWCEGSNCLDLAGWQDVNLGLGLTNGQHPDLELDREGRPHLAYLTNGGGGVGYSRCTAACESEGGAWRHQTLETAADLETAFPVPIPSHCDAGLWDSLTPVLALDPAGQARVAYDTVYEARCAYDDPFDNLPPGTRFEHVRRSVRLIWVTPS